MSERSRFTHSSTSSESKRYFGEKLNKNSSVASHRKGKLYGRNRLEVRNLPLQGHQIRKEDSDFEGNVAEEVIKSGNRTGEYVYASAGKTLQKRRIKKQMVYAEQKRTGEAHKGVSGMFSKARNGIEKAVQKMGEDAVKYVAENPVQVVCAIVLGVLILTVSASLSSCTMMIGAFQGAALTTTYTAEDSEILAVNACYVDLESQLLEQANQIEESYPGYDEYVYTLDEIWHDPYELTSLLTVLYEDYTESEIGATLEDIFAKQYEWSFEEVEETRILEETKTRLELKTRLEEREGITIRWDTEQGKYVWDTYTYEVEVEYWDEVEYKEESEGPYKILKVTLTNASIDEVARSLGLTDDALKRYELLTTMKGNKPYLF